MKEIIKNALSKSKGVKLIQHNKNVSIVTRYLGEQMLVHPTERMLKTLEIAGLLHDIGKMTEDFQNLLRGLIKKTKNKFLHNEIGWVFLYHNFKQEDLDINLNYILNSIYWHHGIYNKYNSFLSHDILKTLSSDNIELMKFLLIELVGEKYINIDNSIDYKKSPVFYTIDDEFNVDFSIIRTCLISADRIVSEIEESNKINLIIDKNNVNEIIGCYLTKLTEKSDLFHINVDLIINNIYNTKRFIKQLDIVNLCDKTSIIKAPAGFGKTLLGLIWASQNNKKTIWVCPRNIIAESVYDSIKKELKKLNLEHISVELFLTGKTMKPELDEINYFSSDIIVTNIDNFLTPSINDRIAKRLILTNSLNVIFDEYHEFVTDSPIFSCFINLMRIRHQNTKSKTLLLSATPVNIQYKWDTNTTKTKILPNENSHYNPIHDRKYLIRVRDEFVYDKKGSEIIIFNSIFESQLQKSKLKDATLFHSKFTKEIKDEKLKFLLKNYDKNAEKNLNKFPIISAQLIQASLDISCRYLYESVQSPEATLQRIGRVGRFEYEFDYQDTDLIITIFKVRDRKNNNKFSSNEKSADEIFYPKNLTDDWFNEMLNYDNKELTLTQIYEIYNNHIKKNELKRKDFFETKYRESLKLLEKIYPKKTSPREFNDNTKQTPILIAGTNKLRSIGNEIFYLVNTFDIKTNKPNNNEYISSLSFTKPIRKSFDIEFEESKHSRGNILTRIKGSMKTIMKNNILNDIDYSEILNNKKITIDEIRRLAVKSNSPYIAYNEVYHPDLGLINIDKLNEL